MQICVPAHFSLFFQHFHFVTSSHMVDIFIILESTLLLWPKMVAMTVQLHLINFIEPGVGS